MKKCMIRCFCADRIDVITNFAVITNAVIKTNAIIKTVHCILDSHEYPF